MKILGLKITRDDYFWAKIDWFLYKYLKIKRKYPCGRTKKNKDFCCCLTPDEKNSYITKDKHEIRCKVCGSVRMISSEPIKNINAMWEF